MHQFAPLFICSTLLFIFYQYVKSISYRDPGSVFFDETRAYQRRYSDARLAQVEDTLIAAAPTGADPSICTVFTTWKRPIDTALKSALAGLYAQERADIHVAVLFAHADPTTHPSWGIEVDKSVYYENGSRLAEYEERSDYMHKGIGDYTLALEYCKNLSLPWTAVFEDDILFADSWYARLKQALIQDHPKELLYMRMFNDERSTGWAQKGFFANQEGYIALVLNALVLAVMRRKSLVTILPVMLFIPGIITLFYAAGKATMLPPNPGIRQENFGCCSQALIYPQHQLQPLIEFLRAEGTGQVDLLINEFGQQRGLHRKSIYPMMVQHKGTSSVRGTTAKDAQQVWSMAFEDLKADQLSREHKQLAGRIWPEILSS